MKIQNLLVRCHVEPTPMQVLGFSRILFHIQADLFLEDGGESDPLFGCACSDFPRDAAWRLHRGEKLFEEE